MSIITVLVVLLFCTVLTLGVEDVPLIVVSFISFHLQYSVMIGILFLDFTPILRIKCFNNF